MHMLILAFTGLSVSSNEYGSDLQSLLMIPIFKEH